jgi:hypothetical protein
MLSADELKKIYGTLDREQKVVFLDGIVEILLQHEDAKAKVFDSTASAAERIALVKDSVELRQLILAAKNQKKVIRKSPENDAQELWQSIERFFEGE